MKLPKGHAALEQWKEPSPGSHWGIDRCAVHFFATKSARDAEIKKRKEAASIELLAAHREKRIGGSAISHSWLAIDRARAEHYIERKGATIETHTGLAAAVSTFLATDLEGRSPTTQAEISARSSAERAAKRAAESKKSRDQVTAGLQARAKEQGAGATVQAYLKRWLATDLDGRPL